MIKTLLNQLPQIGKIEWIGLRPGKKEPLIEVNEVILDPELGLAGDHYRGKSKKRQVTLILAEHLEVVAKLLGKTDIHPGVVRRNIVVSGINLLALKDRTFQIGSSALLKTTGICHPCSRMEENLGPGGYNAIRGHSGITATIIQGGPIRLGDEVKLLPDPA